LPVLLDKLLSMGRGKIRKQSEARKADKKFGKAVVVKGQAWPMNFALTGRVPFINILLSISSRLKNDEAHFPTE